MSPPGRNDRPRLLQAARHDDDAQIAVLGPHRLDEKRPRPKRRRRPAHTRRNARRRSAHLVWIERPFRLRVHSDGCERKNANRAEAAETSVKHRDPPIPES
jgi:hypothetical protein